ncbi:MAG: right-handed parallel beta-helix repeat-containing protein [Bacteroidales bacterium]
MKRLYLFSAFLLIGLLTFAQTNHSGTISSNEAWFMADTPHIITGNLTIADGITLLIQPGCEIYINSNRRMVVNGVLSANGTIADPIVFTSSNILPSSGDWRYIYFNGADAGSIMNYCEVSYGGSSNAMVMIRNSGSNVIVMNSTFSYSAGYGLRLLTASDEPVIMDCSFDNCADYPIFTFADRVKNITGSMSFASNNPDAILVRNQDIYSGTWLNHGVPYVINGNPDIVDMETLTINPGVTIKFDGNNLLRVNGGLIANGTSSEHIIFTSNQPVPAKGDWNRIQFINAEASSLSYCDVFYSGSGTSAIEINDSGSNVSVSNCFIGNSEGYGIYTRNGSMPSISNTTIQDCDDFAIRIQADAVKNITGTMVFSGNMPNAIRVDAQNINTGTWLDHNVPYVVWSDLNQLDGATLTLNPGVQLSFNSNARLRIYGTLVADGEMANPIIFTSNQTVPSPGDWERLLFDGADAGTVLDYCQVLYGGGNNGNLDLNNCGTNVSISNTVIQYSGNYGVMLRGSSSPSFINCEITNNDDIGVYLNGTCAPTFGSNEMEWNDIYGNGNYELRNGTLDIDAMYVYWGTDACGSISDKIYDDEDQGNLGIVSYFPYLDAGHGAPVFVTTWTGAVDNSWHNDGNWDNNSPCGFVDAIIPMAPANQPVVFGNEDCNNLTLEAGSQLTVGTGNSLTVNGDLFAHADAGGTASILENTGLSVVGNTTSQFWVSEERWHYVSPPMSGQTANTFLNLYLYGHNEIDNSWFNIVDETTPLNIGQGYRVWSYASTTGDLSVEFTGGTLNSGTYFLPVSNNGSGWNFVGNPYASAIDWDDLSWIKTYIDGTVYVWDGLQYLTWNGSVGDLTDGIIPAMQSFFVKSNNSNPLLVVSNGARTHGVDPYKSELVNNLLELTVTGNGMYDRTFVNFNTNATEGIDNNLDSYKIMGDENAPQLYTIVGEENMRVNVMPEIIPDMVIPLLLQVNQDMECTILASELGTFEPGVSVYLEDLKDGILIELNQQPEYSFASSMSDEAHRFNIHFQKATIVNETVEIETTIYSNENSVFVKNTDGKLNGASILVYNITGQKVFENKIKDASLNRFDLHLKTGYYVVKVVADNAISSEKVFIK